MMCEKGGHYVLLLQNINSNTQMYFLGFRNDINGYDMLYCIWNNLHSN